MSEKAPTSLPETMQAVMIYGEGDIRVDTIATPHVQAPDQVVIKLLRACICGSDLWSYRGLNGEIPAPRPMGHEYVGTVVELGEAVTGLAVGDVVVGSFATSDNTCEICQSGYQSACVHRTFMSTTQAEYCIIPNAAGTLVKVPGNPTDEQLASLLAASDVLGTGWFAAVAAEAGPGKTVAVIGDGAVGLLGILAAKQLGASRIIAMSRHADRQALARKFGATDIVEARGQEGIDIVKGMTDGLGVHSAIEAVGTQQSMTQAIGLTRPGGHVGFVGVSHGVELDGSMLFGSLVHLHGGPAPVRRFLPELIDLIMKDEINPGLVFDTVLPLADAAEGYKLMDERKAIKVMLTMPR